MAIKYFQNKRGQDVIVPTAEGSTVVVKPNHFVIDNTGTYYSAISELSEVSQGTVVQANLVYTYDPFYFARIYNTTAKIDPAVENDANAPVTTVPGSNTQVIFNDGGAFGADSGMTYDKATDALTLVGPLNSLNLFEIDSIGVLAIGSSAGVRTGLSPLFSNNIAIGKNTLNSVLAGGQNNIGIGKDAATNLTTGLSNTAIGSYALSSLLIGNNNIAIGNSSAARTLTSCNIALGDYALYRNQGGSYNVVFGSTAGYNTLGSHNIFIGDTAGYGNQMGGSVTGTDNIGLGTYTLSNYVTGNYNVALGYNSSSALETGNYNVALGYYSLGDAALGDRNIAIGQNAAYNVESNDNIAIGYQAFYGTYPVSGINNIALGKEALYKNSTGTSNISLGASSLYNATSGSYNVALGFEAGISIIGASKNVLAGYRAGRGIVGSGDNNVFIGEDVAYTLATGYSPSQNVGIGKYALYSVRNGDDNVAIGTSAGNSISDGYQNVCIGQQSGTVISTGSYNVTIGDRAEVGSGNLVEAIAIGRNATVTSSRTAVIGDATLTDVYLGSVSGAAKIHALNIFEDPTTKSIGLGTLALKRDSTGLYNIGIGENSLKILTSGRRNVAIGTNALDGMNTASENVAIGYRAMYDVTTNYSYTTSIGTGSVAPGDESTTVGYYAGGSYGGSQAQQTAVGAYAFSGVSTGGVNNTAIGYNAGRKGDTAGYTGGNNTFVGAYAHVKNDLGYNVGASNITIVGANAMAPENSANLVILGDDNVTEVWAGEAKLANVMAGSVQLSTGARPTADAAHRGMIWYVAGGVDAADTIQICAKDSSNNYAWVDLATIA